MVETISTQPVDMNRVYATLNAWTDKNGNARYYINNVRELIYDYLEAIGHKRRDYYDWVNMCASAGRVARIIEDNILPHTKAYIDSDGFIHVYGWACTGEGARRELDLTIINAINRVYGIHINKNVYKSRVESLIKDKRFNARDNAHIGDVVRIVKGRKAVGDAFIITRVSYYHYNQWAKPTVYLHGNDGFKVNAENCQIISIGYSDTMERIN